MFSGFRLASGYPQNTGRILPSTVKAIMSPRWSCVRSYVSVLASQDPLITSEFMCLEAYGLDIRPQQKSKVFQAGHNFIDSHRLAL